MDAIKLSETGIIIFGVLLVVIIILLLRLRKLSQTSKVYQNRIKSLESDKNKIDTLIKNQVEQSFHDLQQQIQEKDETIAQLKIAHKKSVDELFLTNSFLANISHEIRTSLNAIIGFANLLEDELSKAENAELYEYANGINESGERLLRLLNNFMDLSRVEANEIEVKMESCDIVRIVDQTVDLFRFKANEKGLRLNVIHESTTMCMTDPILFAKILTEVIDNAINYTQKGFVNISTTYTANHEEVCIRIKDTGMGIDHEYLKDIFEPYRPEGSKFSLTYGGLGLGLPLSKKIIEMMNGRIEIESEKGYGTSVSLFFKASSFQDETSITKKSAKSEIALSTQLEAFYQNIRILVVEDDRMNRMVLKKMLHNFMDIEMAKDGDEAMALIKSRHNERKNFEIVFMDINLPAPWNGITLMKTIRENFPFYRQIPFIALTAYAMAEDTIKFIHQGFDDYISKPVAKAYLLKIIQKHLIENKNV